jgi:Hemerythrin HHE cation binding domain
MSRAEPIDATELLLSQHRRLEDLLRDLLDADEADARRSRLRAVADELTLHVVAEERVFYPAVRGARTDDILLESLEEHLSLKRLLVDLMALDPEDTTFVPKAKVLAEQAVHHHGEEEEHLFPTAHLLLDAAHREAVGRDMLRLQGEMRLAGHPREALLGSTDAAAELEP